MAGNPSPRVNVFAEGQTFDTPETLALFNNNVLMIRAKFGALTVDDLTGGSISPLGPVDMRSNLISNISEGMKVINLSEVTTPIHTLVANMTSGGVLLVPPNYSHNVTKTIVMRDDVHIVGCGHSSILAAVTTLGGGTTGFNLISSGTARRWSVRQLVLRGRRGFHTVGNGIRINGVKGSDILIENAIIGASNLDGQTTLCFPQSGIVIDGSSQVICSGNTIRLNGGTGIFLRNASSWISLSNNKIQRNAKEGIRCDSVTWINKSGNIISLNSLTNMVVATSKRLSIGENLFQNASTASAAARDNVYLTNSDEPTFVSNDFVDDRRDGKRSRFHLNFNTVAGSRRAIVVENFFNNTTNTVAAGKVNEMRLGLGILATPATISGFCRDQNRFGESYFETRFRFSGGWYGHTTTDVPASAEGLFEVERDGQWNSIFNPVTGGVLTNSDAISFRPVFPELLCHPGDPIPFAQDQIQIGTMQAHARDSEWSETGLPQDGRFIGFKAAQSKMANPGSALTPNLFMTSHTNFDEEVGAIHATFNIYQRAAGAISAHPSGGVLREPNGVKIAYSNWRPWWGRYYAVAGEYLESMRDNVLSSWITSVSPFLNATGNLGRPQHVVVWSGLTGRHRDQRPTWVSIHI